ncbi:MAG: substrate-binding domain-containing protein, partial [Spirochaetota bacterium]
TKKRIIQKASDLGYSPNRLAQFLVTGKTLNIAMITPGDPLWNEVKEGANSFLAEMGNHIVKINWHETSVHDPERETEILQRVLDKGVDGIGIAPADPKMFTGLINQAVQKNIPVVTFNTDAPESKRLCFVGQDPILAGRIGGELMGKFLMGTGKVVIITAFKNVLVHRCRLNAFLMVMEEWYPGIDIEEVYENHDNEEEAYRQIKGFLSQTRKIDGIYLTTGNGPMGVVRALGEAGLEGQVRIVCFDFFPDTVQLLKSDLVHATIGEDPFNQGYQTVKILYDYAIDKKEPLNRLVHTKIDIGLRENIDSLVRGSTKSLKRELQ